ncbi:MAG: response regulator transcription factor [Firmicutes bacterium]|nr:response regulator transcription factor [Bacillota bacterium]
MASKVLVVDDEPAIVEVVRFAFERNGYEVQSASNGVEALSAVRLNRPDLVVLDLMLPELDGIEVCKRIRTESSVPIIILTARGDEADRVVGLELGADDYVSKPFSPRELVARARAVLRRSAPVPGAAGQLQDVSALSHAQAQASAPVSGTLLKGGPLIVDALRHEVRLDGAPVELSPKEYDLLCTLLANKGIVMSRETLLRKVWGYDYSGDTRTVDVHIVRLRQKLEKDPATPEHILTVRGAGYKFKDDSAEHRPHG